MGSCTRDIHLRTEGTFIFNLDLKRKKEVIKYLPAPGIVQMVLRVA